MSLYDYVIPCVSLSHLCAAGALKKESGLKMEASETREQGRQDRRRRKKGEERRVASTYFCPGGVTDWSFLSRL